jgi:F0F1-type ATP synthase epsilon subunit
MSGNKPIKVKVRDSKTVVYEGEVERISSYNEIGPFDVYPEHANFISILQKELSLFHKKEKVKELKIEKAILKVKQDVVHIFLGIEAFDLGEEPSTAPASSPPPEKK